MRLVRQGGADIPNVLAIFPQSSTEFIGRCAGVGYCSVVIGSTRGLDPTGHAPNRVAKSKISSAKPCQLVVPVPVKWKVPQFALPRSICSAITITAEAMSAAAVGQPC